MRFRRRGGFRRRARSSFRRSFRRGGIRRRVLRIGHRM